MAANARNGLAIANNKWQNQQLIQPLHLLVLNLMPTKITTELQFLKQFNHLSADVQLTFLYPASHHFKGTQTKIMTDSYFNFVQVKAHHYDGLIITGAPVEKLPFTQVDYWQEFCQIIAWTHHHVLESLFECWAAQAGLFIDFAIPKRCLKNKLFGVFTATTPYLGTGGIIKMPQSRHSTSILDPYNLPADLQILANSKEVGPMILQSRHLHHTYITGHPEYDRDTLAKEYQRDQQKHLAIQIPQHYFTDENNDQVNYSWQSTAHLIYQNWLNTITNEKAGYQTDYSPSFYHPRPIE